VSKTESVRLFCLCYPGSFYDLIVKVLMKCVIQL
jgi:hypothetical protein